MTTVSQPGTIVCPCGSNRTWLLIFATFKIICNAILFLFFFFNVWLSLVQTAFRESKLDPILSCDGFGKFMMDNVGSRIDILVFVTFAVVFALSLVAAICPVVAEWKKRPGFLFPWYVLIIVEVFGDIAMGVLCVVYYSYSAAFLCVIQFAFDLVAFNVTVYRGGELKQKVAAPNPRSP